MGIRGISFKDDLRKKRDDNVYNVTFYICFKYLDYQRHKEYKEKIKKGRKSRTIVVSK